MPKGILPKAPVNGFAVTDRVTVAAATFISMGTFLTLTDPNTGVAATAASGVAAAPGAGIAAMDKDTTGGDTSTDITVWTKGTFDLTASGAISIGAPVCFIVDNYVAQVTNPIVTSGAAVIGYAKETASDNEQILVRLDL